MGNEGVGIWAGGWIGDGRMGNEGVGIWAGGWIGDGRMGNEGVANWTGIIGVQLRSSDLNACSSINLSVCPSVHICLINHFSSLPNNCDSLIVSGFFSTINYYNVCRAAV